MSKRKIESIEERVQLLEKIQGGGIDWLANEMKGLFQNDDVIGSAVEEHDTTIAAIKALLVEKGILTEREISTKKEQIDRMRAEAVKAREKEAEMLQIAEQAKKAALEEQGHPPEAFLFGGQ